MNDMSSAFDYIDKKQFTMWVYDGTVERIVEHHETILEGNSKYFIVKMEKRPYKEPIKLKLLNDLWEVRSNFVINGVWTDRLHDDEGRVLFSVFTNNNRYWEIVYKHQGKRYPRPRRCKSKAWRERMSKKAGMV